MLVRATNRGFYHWMRQIGDVFEIPDALHEPLWQEKVETEAPAPAAAAPPAVEAEAETLTTAEELTPENTIPVEESQP